MSSTGPDIYHVDLDGGLALAWVNSYSAVAVRTPGATLMFDPVSLQAPDGVSLDLIAISHGHPDHWDPRLVEELSRRTGALVAAPPFLASRLARAVTGREAHPHPNLPPSRGKELSRVKPLAPGDWLEVQDVAVTALRCDHAAREPVSFVLRTADNIAVYLPGDSAPFPEMRRLTGRPHPDSLAPAQGRGGTRPLEVDVLVWMGTALEDGAEIAYLVRPKAFVTYAIAPPAAGARARGILTRHTPNIPFHALQRHQIFVYPPAR